MKLVYFAHSVLERGGDKMVLAHLRHLAEAGHRVTIRSNVVATGYPLHPYIDIDKPLLPGKGGTLASALLRPQRCDVVLATIVPTALFLRLRNRRVVYFAQDDNETAYPFPVYLLLRFMYLFAFRVFRIPTIAVSHALAATFTARFGARCLVVENGVDTSIFYPARSQQLVASKQGRKAILVLARRDHRKGFDLACEAVSMVAPSRPIEVWTVGEDIAWNNPDVPSRSFGRVNVDAMREIMSSADLFLYPSRSEGFPLMVLEAFACCCPVVTSEAVTYVRHEENALVSPIGDVESLARDVLRLLDDAALAASLASAGLSFARDNTEQRCCARFEAELARLVPDAMNDEVKG
ncbi:glycosyltransferase family 4 protein [Geomonas oryzae]|uniref:glycosyltransferase family 4 protein n=1 Tax=Geomonas oryzae TaxID=2364273 RepID=UPI00100C3043|nr:glycosyltransferase family 4 protein [Geomonas oryzae]